MSSLVNRSILIVAAALILLLQPLLADAAVDNITTTVTRTLVDDTLYGGCMIELSRMPDQVSCGNVNWVTASCSGDFNPSNVGWRKFESGQLAQALNKRVSVVVDDSMQHNGRCFLRRIVVN